MVSYLGMSKKVGNLSFYNSGGSEYAFTKPYSEKTAELIDNEVKQLVEVQYERAKKVLLDNKEKHHALAERLLQREVIFTEDMVEIFGERPWEKEVPLGLANGDAKTAQKTAEQEAGKREVGAGIVEPDKDTTGTEKK